MRSETKEFNRWTEKMYRRNCEERAMYKEKPYNSCEEYTEKNLAFLKNKYRRDKPNE